MTSSLRSQTKEGAVQPAQNDASPACLTLEGEEQFCRVAWIAAPRSRHLPTQTDRPQLSADLHLRKASQDSCTQRKCSKMTAAKAMGSELRPSQPFLSRFRALKKTVKTSSQLYFLKTKTLSIARQETENLFSISKISPKKLSIRRTT